MVVGDISSGTDVLVVGGGPAGYTAAIRSAQHGKDVVLVDDREDLGGVCLNEGCIPSKALIHGADMYHEAGGGEAYGLSADPGMEYGTLQEWKDDIIGTLTTGIEALEKQYGVEVRNGRAELQAGGSARIEGVDGAESIDYEHCIIATGSEPITLDGFEPDGERVITSKGALELDAVPDSMVVIGGGYIGMELGFAYQKLGADVTVLEAEDHILPGYSEELVRPVEARAEELGMAIVTNALAQDTAVRDDGVTVTAEVYEEARSATAAEPVDPYDFEFPDVGEGVTEGELLSWLVEEGDPVTEDLPLAEVETDKAVVEVPSPLDGHIVELHAEEGDIIEVGNVLVTLQEEGGDAVETETVSEEERYDADTVLTAVGRVPYTDGLGLENTDVDVHQGFIATDDQMRTEEDSIFAVGDVAGNPMLAHKGYQEAKVAADVIAGESEVADFPVPEVIYTDPEIATVGLDAAEAEDEGYDVVTGSFPFQASGRAATLDRQDGHITVVAEEGSDVLLGAQMAGPNVSELISEAALAVNMGARLYDVAKTPHPHPTLAEAFQEACEDALGQPIHTYSRD